MTDAVGEFFLPLPPGEWQLSVRAPGYREAKIPVRVDSDQQTPQRVVLRPTS